MCQGIVGKYYLKNVEILNFYLLNISPIAVALASVTVICLDSKEFGKNLSEKKNGSCRIVM